MREPRPYAYRIVTNLARDRWRAEQRERVAWPDLTDEAPAPAPDDTTLDAVRRLSPALREAVLLHYYADLPVDEVARVLRRPVGTVKRRLFDARAALAAALEDVRCPMSELPELPPLTRRTRPLPAGGLDAVLAGGRRRRHRALAVASGTTTALAVVVAAVVVLPGGASDELSLADPTRSPAPAVTATAVPEPEQEQTTPPAPVPPLPTTDAPGLPSAPADPTAAGADGGEAAPQGGPSAASGPARPARPGVPAAPPADAGPTAAPARPVEERPAYVEDTDEDAPGAVGCTPSKTMDGTTPGAPDGTGSTTTGGACTYSSGFSSGEIVRRGDQAQVVLGYCVSQGGEDDVWQFDGGQEKEVVAVDRNGLREVFRFSPTVRYVEGAHEVRLRPGTCVQWTGRWDLVTTDGRPVPAGEYSLSMAVKADRFLPAYREPRGFEETITTKVTVVD
jgi:hypothetical protein